MSETATPGKLSTKQKMTKQTYGKLVMETTTSFSTIKNFVEKSTKNESRSIQNFHSIERIETQPLHDLNKKSSRLARKDTRVGKKKDEPKFFAPPTDKHAYSKRPQMKLKNGKTISKFHYRSFRYKVVPYILYLPHF